MHVQPRVEELEERSLLNAADLASFQQQLLPSLQSQFQTLVPLVQSTLQTDLNRIQGVTPLLPALFQPLLGAVFAQGQQFVNAFPVLANISFQQRVIDFEEQLLEEQPPASSVVVSPFFLFPFFPGGFFFPGAGAFGGGGVAFTSGSGFTSGFGFGSSGFSGGSGSGGSGDPPTIMGRGMGLGLMTTAGALTLPPINRP
ncbi:MAG TPA: hypothetical protein VH643_38400 [Gemmataceae bacterium]|jgi:hypothetical protein